MAPVSTTGHQATSLKTIAPKPLLRIRSPAKKIVRRSVRSPDRGQRPQLQKNRGARATTLGPQIRNDYADKLTSRRGQRLPATMGLPQRGNAYQPRVQPWDSDSRETVRSEGTPHRGRRVSGSVRRGRAPQLQPTELQPDEGNLRADAARAPGFFPGETGRRRRSPSGWR